MLSGIKSMSLLNIDTKYYRHISFDIKYFIFSAYYIIKVTQHLKSIKNKDLAKDIHIHIQSK